jgi:hypothetical protein
MSALSLRAMSKDFQEGYRSRVGLSMIIIFVISGITFSAAYLQ